MPPNIWLPILLIIFFLGAFISNPWLIAISVAVAFIILSAQLWRLKSLDNVFYRRRWHYRRGFPGEKTDVRIEVENRKWLPLSWLKTSDIWPFGVPPENEDVLKHSHLPQRGRLINIFSLRWFEKISRKYTLVFKERGVYPVGPVDFSSGDLFGLYELRKDDKKLEYLTVFPELLPIKSIGLETDNPMGELRSRRRLFEDPNRPMGVREYRPEDEFRRIHWPATARTGQLQVKIYQTVQSKVVVICLNISTSRQHWLGLNKPLSEHLIKVAATLSHQTIHDGYAVGLISNSCLSHSDQPFIIQPGQSTKQLTHLLESLARITSYVTTPFEVFLAKSLPQLPLGASLVIVTALVTPELCETLMRIKRYRSYTTLISLEKTAPPEISGITCIHLPFENSQFKEERL